MERLGALDAMFLSVEDAVNHMHIGSVGIFEGPPPPPGDVRALVASKLDRIPRYRQKVMTAPFSVGRPVWVDDPHFRLDYHLRHTALPSPGDHEALRALVGRVMSQQLDRHKPLWEMWLVEGLPDGQWAAISKVHHCMVDGVAGSDLLATMLDLEARTDVPGAPPRWEPEAEPSAAALAWHSLAGIAAAPAQLTGAAMRAVRHAGTLAERALQIGRGVVPAVELLWGQSERDLVAPIGPHRRWEYVDVELDEVKRVRKSFGATVNDVAVAMVTRGLRDLCRTRGAIAPDRNVRSLIPVSMRDVDGRGVLDNRVTALVAELPVGVDDPIERLGVVRRRLGELKASGEAATSAAIVDLVGLAPPSLAAACSRVVVHRQRSVETITTNVPGPQLPLYLQGRKMVRAYPYVPIAGQIRVATAIWSYCGTLHFGITADADDTDDLAVMAAGLSAELAELAAYAR